MWQLAFALIVVLGRVASAQTVNESDPLKILIINTGKFIPYEVTDVPTTGYAEGNILNFHYYPGIKYYQAGRYVEANSELNYFLQRPYYLEGNVFQSQYMSTGFYLRGMILLHHATGYGRLSRAREDFEQAIKWNPKNYFAHLELSRVFSTAGLKSEAIVVVRHLIELEPPQDIVEEAQKELKSLGASRVE